MKNQKSGDEQEPQSAVAKYLCFVPITVIICTFVPQLSSAEGWNIMKSQIMPVRSTEQYRLGRNRIFS
jgi:hypothetical protein